MPLKRRWALNPRKWFGSISNTAHKREKNNQVIDCIIPLPPPVKPSSRIIPATAIVPRVLTSKSKTKITPILSINDNNNNMNSSGSFTRFQLIPYNPGREKTSGLLTSTTLFNHANTFVSTHFEPSIPKRNGQSKEELSIYAARKNTETINYDTSQLLTPPLQYENTIPKQSEMKISNLSHQDLHDCLQNLSENIINKSPVPRRSHSSSSLSIDSNDTRDESSSSGVFTDERADTNDLDRKASKDTLSTLEVLSVESIANSQTSLNHDQSRSSSRQYRLPLLSLETIETKSTRLPSEISAIRSYRAYSAENILKDNPVLTPVIPRNRQSSAAIIKKIEKRTLPGRSPPIALEKAAFVRVANDTYRLTTDKDDHLYRRQRQNSVIHYLHHEDSLPPANDEESYATLPRTSSTDQLNNNLENDLRAIVDDCFRPMAASINKKTSSSSTKTQHRSKRSQTNNEHTQINIDDLTDKLLSSVACSTYSQYQRCY